MLYINIKSKISGLVTEYEHYELNDISVIRNLECDIPVGLRNLEG